MRKIPRARERTATPEELEEDRRRCLATRTKTTPAPIEGNLCAVLVTFAAWRPCCVCGSLTLYVNENARTDSDFECGLCKEIRESLAKRLRPSLPMLAALHMRALFSTANDNGARA
jgi:tRNA A37 N6-isopentenylltransferase MiaA